MGEVLLMLLTGGGSTAMGAMLKGVFGFIFETKRQKHELELARESRANDNFIRLQEQLSKSGDTKSVSYTRKWIALCGIGTYCLCILATTWWPQAEFISISNPTGEGRTEWFFGLLSYPSAQKPIIISSGHLAFMGQTSLCAILGFYFGPSPRRR